MLLLTRHWAETKVAIGENVEKWEAHPLSATNTPLDMDHPTCSTDGGEGASLLAGSGPARGDIAPMKADALLTDLARVAHELWRRAMKADGWKRGAFSPERRTHDAMVPYDELPRPDRLALHLRLVVNELANRLVETVEYPRGADRPFVIEEMQRGLEVALSDEFGPARLGDVHEKHRGKVESWEVGTDGELSLITVRWGDSEVVSYDPWERALTRASELE
jgi:hypothetical protein